MNISPKFKSLSLKVLSEGEFAAIKDIPVKDFIVQQALFDSFLVDLTHKGFPWLPKDAINKVQSSMPFILSLFTPGETIRMFVQLNIEIMGLPIASRSRFSIRVVK